MLSTNISNFQNIIIVLVTNASCFFVLKNNTPTYIIKYLHTLFRLLGTHIVYSWCSEEQTDLVESFNKPRNVNTGQRTFLLKQRIIA